MRLLRAFFIISISAIIATPAFARDDDIKDFYQAIAPKPDDANIHNQLANSQVKAALASARRAVALAPHNANIQDTLGGTLCRNGRIKPALAAWARSRAWESRLAKVKQRHLWNEKYYHGTINGKFGPASVKALRAWAQAGCSGL